MLSVDLFLHHSGSGVTTGRRNLEVRSILVQVALLMFAAPRPLLTWPVVQVPALHLVSAR